MIKRIGLSLKNIGGSAASRNFRNGMCGSRNGSFGELSEL